MEKDMKVTIRLGRSNFTDLSFPHACNLIKSFLELDQQSRSEFDQKMTDSFGGVLAYWTTDHIARLRRKFPPDFKDWNSPIWWVEYAKKRYISKDYETAERALKNAQNDFNRLHNQWLNYRNALIKGSEQTIEKLELTITLCQVAIAVGTGGVAGGSLIVTSGIGTLSVGVAEMGKELSRRGAFNEDFMTFKNFDKIGAQMVESFATSILGGAMSGKFFKVFVRRVNKLARSNPIYREALENETWFGRSFKARKYYEFPAGVIAGVISNAFINALKHAIFLFLKVNQGKNKNPTETLAGITDLIWKTNKAEAFALFLKIMEKSATHYTPRWR